MNSHDQCSTHIQIRAAAIVHNEGAVLLHKAHGDTFWALPGGRVEIDEDAAEAVARELDEELGISVQVTALSMIVENFFNSNGQRYHEIGFYFRVLLDDCVALPVTQIPFTGIEDKGLVFQWIPISALGDHDVRPAFLKRELNEEQATAKHIVCRDGIVSNASLDSIAMRRLA